VPTKDNARGVVAWAWREWRGGGGAARLQKSTGDHLQPVVLQDLREMADVTHDASGVPLILQPTFGSLTSLGTSVSFFAQ
jgi:hypothetical protein